MHWFLPPILPLLHVEESTFNGTKLNICSDHAIGLSKLKNVRIKNVKTSLRVLTSIYRSCHTEVLSFHITEPLSQERVLFMFLKISYRQYNKWLHNPQTIILLFTLRCKTQSVCLCQSNMKAPTVLQSKNRALFVFALFNRQDSSTK